MKTLFKFLAIGILGAAAGLPLPCAAEPTLEDFGYGAMRTDRTLYLAVILVNFTNTPVPDSVAKPYVTITDPVGTNYAAAERFFTNWFFTMNGSTNPTVNGYLHEASNGRMRCRMAGLTMLTLDTNLNYAGVAARVGGGGGRLTATMRPTSSGWPPPRRASPRSQTVIWTTAGPSPMPNAP